MNVVLISTYELGRQPFGLASPAAWLGAAGATVTCLDLAVEAFAPEPIAAAELVAFYVPMHTATRLATSLVSKVRKLNPRAHLCFFGLYAPVNEAYLRKLGAGTILGGEFEQGLVDLVTRLSTPGGDGKPLQAGATVSLARQQFLLPDRSALPPLSRYARLHVAPGDERIVGYTEASRGCKHTCRHCPIVPVYEGQFRIVQRDVVLRDIEQQVARGAQHLTFGDPDFFNGPTHAVQIVTALHERFPQLTYDVTIKVEHLVKHAQHLPLLRDTGCLFVTSAVESIDPMVLEIFDKRHTREDFVQAVEACRAVELNLTPTFVTFTPWTSLKSYLELLTVLFELDLLDNVPPVQYGIRLLIPAGSKLLDLPAVRDMVGDFDEAALAYPWAHADPAVDELYRQVLATVKQAQARQASRREVFSCVWELAQGAYASSVSARLKRAAVDLVPQRAEVPYLSEPWYC
jgi:radical SAM superfamily enzyme YgiQ (UPF0313 family)